MAKGEKNSQAWVDGESSSNEGVRHGKRSRGGLKGCCGRLWWVFLLIAIIVVVLVLIPILLVVVPQKAQAEVNRASITVNQQSLMNPGSDTYDLTINTTVVSHSSHIGATVEAFNASYYLLTDSNNNTADLPFVSAEFPSVIVNDTNYVNIGAQSVPIYNMDQFIAYNKLVLNSEYFSVAVKGRTHVQLSGLPKAGINYDQIVTQKGFNKLQGFKINTLQLHNPALFDGATMTGTVTIPNPSVITSQFGNVTMNLSANGTFLGTAKLLYVDFKPGNNTYDMRGYVDLGAAITYTQNYILNLDIVGNSSVNIVGEHLVYFEEALKSNPIQYRLNLTEVTSGTSS